MHLDAPARRITTWLAILGYALVASGLPLPFGVVDPPAAGQSVANSLIAAKDRSRPFPCMNRPCGCDTADRCFTSCCCHTPAETLAWARAHGAEPALIVALEHRMQGRRSPAAPVVPAPPKPSCCSGSAAGADASCEATAGKNEAPPLPAVGEAAVAKALLPPASPADPSAVDGMSSRALVLRAMLACGGMVAEWLAVGAALPPPRVEVCLAMRPHDACATVDETGDCPRAAPAAPPPRAA